MVRRFFLGCLDVFGGQGQTHGLQMRHIVLNCANIGCYGRASAGSKFSWEGVERAFKFYDDEGYTVHAIIGQRLLHRAGTKALSAKPLVSRAKI